MEKDKQPGGLYANTYAERRRKRHRKGQTRMNVLLIVLVVLVVIWLFLPGTTSDTSPSERTRNFSAAEEGSAAQADAADYTTEDVPLPPEDIAPNPLLEVYIDQELRESPYRFEITYPNQEARLAPQADGTHLFRLAGKLFAKEEKKEAEDETDKPDKEFRVYLFSNKPEDYENFQPIFTEDLTFQVEGDHFVFQLSHPEDLDPGLYYYLIEEKEEGEVFVVGKVMVV